MGNEILEGQGRGINRTGRCHVWQGDVQADTGRDQVNHDQADG